MGDVASVRNALLELHRQLLEAQRIQAERFSGRMTASELLQAPGHDVVVTFSGPASSDDDRDQLKRLLASRDSAARGRLPATPSGRRLARWMAIRRRRSSWPTASSPGSWERT